MGKVKDEVSEGRATRPAPKAGKPARRRANQFLATLFTSRLYKPMQGWNARLSTGLAIGAVLLVGVWRVFEGLDGLDLPGTLAGSEFYVRCGVCGLLAAGLAWLSFRLIHYPPFADFLIATQAEMNKVSWISREDLVRATVVVLITVLLLSVFLFGIDQVWMTMLDAIGVLEVSPEGGGEGIGSAG